MEGQTDGGRRSPKLAVLPSYRQGAGRASGRGEGAHVRHRTGLQVAAAEGISPHPSGGHPNQHIHLRVPAPQASGAIRLYNSQWVHSTPCGGLIRIFGGD